MNQASILALATALPPHAFDQEEIAEKMIAIFAPDSDKAERLRQLYHNSGIKTRYSVVSDFLKERYEWDFWGSDYPKSIPGMAKRNDIYKKAAPKLAYEAAAKAIQKWGRDPSEITHIISISCTGIMAPGIEFDLMRSLHLNNSVNRLGINFMGCFGAFKGLAVAQSFAKENPHHRILIVCTELCSLHLQANQNPDNILANSLFSDGAAAVIVGAHPKDNEKSLWSIEKQQSISMDKTTDKMTWEAGDHGFLMKLSPAVPVLLGREITPFTESLLGNISIKNCDWAIHPGGKSIIQAIEKAISLDPVQTQASWKTLSQYGNMSSATFLFVLENLLQQSELQKWAVGLGFGPGLSIEGILLKRS